MSLSSRSELGLTRVRATRVPMYADDVDDVFASREPEVDLPPGAIRLLAFLQRQGPLSADELASRVGLSRTMVGRHLRELGKAGLAVRWAVRHGVGRPLHVYDATREAEALLPADYESLAQSLLDATRDVGGNELIARIVDARRRTRSSALKAQLESRCLASASLPDRARALAEILDAEGYFADVTEDRGLRLNEHHCPLLAVAEVNPVFCDAELRLVAQVLGVLVERESNIAAGGRACVFRLRARERDYPIAVWTTGQMRGMRVDQPSIESEQQSGPWTAEKMRPAAPDTRKAHPTR